MLGVIPHRGTGARRARGKEGSRRPGPTRPRVRVRREAAYPAPRPRRRWRARGCRGGGGRGAGVCPRGGGRSGRRRG